MTCNFDTHTVNVGQHSWKKKITILYSLIYSESGCGDVFEKKASLHVQLQTQFSPDYKFPNLWFWPIAVL